MALHLLAANLTFSDDSQLYLFICIYFVNYSYHACVTYWQQFCNNRQFLYQNIEMNNKGILIFSSS